MQAIKTIQNQEETIMKKTTKALLLAAMTVTALAGCSSKPADPAATATEAVTTTAAADTTAAEAADSSPAGERSAAGKCRKRCDAGKQQQRLPERWR